MGNGGGQVGGGTEENRLKVGRWRLSFFCGGREGVRRDCRWEIGWLGG